MSEREEWDAYGVPCTTTLSFTISGVLSLQTFPTFEAASKCALEGEAGVIYGLRRVAQVERSAMVKDLRSES